MKAKKLLAGLLSTVMVLSSMALPAFAEETKTVVAKIGTVEYTDLAAALNAANEGDAVVLQDNITLTGEWAPIAGFKGTFDGNGKTISGLKITAAGKNTKAEAATGLFADLTAATAVVKNLTIDGAEIKFSDATTRVGILAGYLYGATVENITVTNATVNVTGGQYVGGLCGKLHGTAANCTISNSTITGKDQVGGLVGYAWIGHMDSCKSISNTIKATEERAGGLIGKMSILHDDMGSGSQYVKNCTVSGGSATAPDYAGGLIAQFMGDCDWYSITGNTVEKITLNAPKTSAFATIRDGQIKDFMDSLATKVTGNKFNVAAIGDTEYASLKDALEAAQDSDTVKLLADIEVTESINMYDDKKITLDTAGRTVTFNGGSISLRGSSLSVTGSGTISHVMTSGATQAIYVFDAKSTLTIDSVDLNTGSNNGLFAAEAGSIVINGGNFTMTNGGAVAFAFGENTKVEINGGTFVGRDGGEGAVYAFNGANVAVSGGKFDMADQDGKYNYTFCDYSGLIGYPGFNYGGNGVTSKGIFKVTGGTYNKDITNLTQLKYTGTGKECVDGNFGGFVTDGYIVIKNTDGIYTVTKENFDNENVTTEEKVDTINNVVISKDNTEVTEKVVEAIKTLPVEKKEEVAPAKVEEIIATKDASEVKEATAATIASEDTAAVTATVKSIDSSLELKIEPKAAADSTIKLPEGTKAARFEVTVEKATGTSREAVTETDVPLLLTFTVDAGINIKSVIRNHEGTQESVPFTQDGNVVKVSAAKFSEYDVVYAATPKTGSAVLTIEDDTDGDGICNLYLVGDTGATVTNFESGEFTIANTVTSGKVGIEITGADGLTIDEVKDGYYKIHRPDGSKTYRTVETGSKILLGTIALSGTGKGQIYAENIKMYRKSTDNENLAVEIPTVSDHVDYDIKAEAATLTVNVTFPNAVENQVTAYQDMKITISDGDLADDLIYKLGSDVSSNVAWNNTTDATYTLTVADKLTKNVAYTVKVEGAGYRTARYIVNMTDAKTLNFWNNVKDMAICVEEGVGTAKNTTFLAGDIVKDNQINIYDLSAVVSYFGTNNLVDDHPGYAKYDLNRDGKIDSKDIAYVLVSWGK